MKKKILNLLIILATAMTTNAQVKIGGAGVPDANAVLELDGGNNRGLLMPRLTDAEMMAMPAAAGMVVYNTTHHGLYLRRGGLWVRLTDYSNAFSLPHLGTYNVSPGAVLDLYNIGGVNGIGIMGRSNEGKGIVGTSGQGTGVEGIATSGIGGQFSASNGFPAIQTGTGSVCIGTNSSMKAKLLVNGSWGNVSARFGESTAGVAVEIGDPAITFNTYNIGGRKAMVDGYGGYMTLSPITGKFQLFTSPASGTADNVLSMTNRITITREGNMGIQGDTDPHSPLGFADQLGNKISLWGSTAASHYGFGIQPYLLQMYSGSSADDIAFGYGSSTAFTENMRIKGNGMIGIGTTTPTYPVTLASNAAGFVQKGGTVEVGTAITATAGVIKTFSNHALQFTTNNNPTPHMSLTAAGDLGIGTTIPVGKMHVRDDQENVFVIENSTALDDDVPTKMLFRPGNTYTGGIATIGTSSIFARMGFFTDVTGASSLLKERMSILDNGNVGINTIAPAAKLEVAGKTKITQGPGDNSALEISGPIAVSGPTKAAFVRTVTPTDVQANSHQVVIDNSMCNNDPNAILIVTARNSTPVWVEYDDTLDKWKLLTGGEHISGYSILSVKTCSDFCLHPKILGSSANAFASGEKFNILVIKSL